MLKLVIVPGLVLTGELPPKMTLRELKAYFNLEKRPYTTINGTPGFPLDQELPEDARVCFSSIPKC